MRSEHDLMKCMLELCERYLRPRKSKDESENEVGLNFTSNANLTDWYCLPGEILH